MTLLFNTQINSEQELINLTKKILSMLSKGSVVLLSGDLSAGKTTIVSHFCKIFGIQIIQSPTYSIHQRYSNINTTIDHFDLYRLESEEDIESSGFFDLLHAAADYKFIEWSDRVKNQDFPKGVPIFKILISILDQNSRQIEIYKLD